MSQVILDSGCWIREMAIRIGPAGSDSLGYMKALSRGVEVTLINESPQAYPDAAMMKRVIRQLLKAASG